MIEIPNFSYMIPGKVAGSAHPDRGGRLAESLSALHAEGIRGILTLYERPLDAALLGEFGMQGLHIPVPDFGPPTQLQIDRSVDFMRKHSGADSKVLVHCLMGYGRTGTMLACLLVTEGRTAQEAIREVRDVRPGSIEDPSQEQAIHAYERRLRPSGEVRKA